MKDQPLASPQLNRHSEERDFQDFSLYKRVPNLDLIRLNRLKYFNLMGCLLLTANAIIWGIIWYNLDHIIMSVFSLLFLPFSAFIYSLTKRKQYSRGFVVLVTGAAIWIIIIAIAASGPGRSYGGSVHSYFLTLAAIVYFAFVGKSKAVHWSITICMLALFFLFEFSPIDYTPVIEMPEKEREIASYITWCSSIITFFVFFFWLAKDINDVESKLNFSNSRMEELLENILPPEIAKKLSEEGKTFAEGYLNCTVLFADIVNFTELAKQSSPERLVRLLNQVFAEFDDATQKFGVEKIKTIGDAYMVAAGVPSFMEDHANRTVSLAQEFLSILEKYPEINIRIGINSGPVTAGVIGKKKFIYDLWGDTVNVAARMEQFGIENKIHLSEATYQLIHQSVSCEPRGEMEVKGLGRLQTYLVNEITLELTPA